MSKLSELYQLLLDEPDYYAYDGRLFRNGICLKIWGFLKTNIFTVDEYMLIEDDLVKHLPEGVGVHNWAIGKTTGRIRFIKKRIQDLTNQNK